MVKFTSFLLAAVSVLAVTNAQVSPQPGSASIVDLDHYTHSNNLERRAVTKKPAKPSAKLTKDQKSILDTHNKYRTLHQAGPLKWNATLATFGAKWLAQQQDCDLHHSGGPYGENLAAGYSNYKSGINAWYNEVTKYNFNKPGFSMGTGHFTQVVWKGSKSVGCAKKFCAARNWTIYICNYYPPGNFIGDFPKNVLPKKKSASKKPVPKKVAPKRS